MGWAGLKKGMDSNFVSCDEKYELDTIKEEFTYLSDTKNFPPNKNTEYLTMVVCGVVFINLFKSLGV